VELVVGDHGITRAPQCQRSVDVRGPAPDQRCPLGTRSRDWRASDDLSASARYPGARSVSRPVRCDSGFLVRCDSGFWALVGGGAAVSVRHGRSAFLPECPLNCRSQDKRRTREIPPSRSPCSWERAFFRHQYEGSQGGRAGRRRCPGRLRRLVQTPLGLNRNLRSSSGVKSNFRRSVT
jgi:hypothetical protein